MSDDLFALADRLCSVEPLTYGEVNAIANALRRLDRILDAIGDPEELRYHARGDVADAATPRCACGQPATEHLDGIPTCGNDR